MRALVFAWTCPWWGEDMNAWDVGGMWLWGTLMMATWVAIVAAAFWFVMRAVRGGDRSSRAREILDERFARGELSPEEYRDRVETLR
jgi:putative membrane protein